MSDSPEAILSHKINNRARLKIPSKKGDSNYFKSIIQKLSEIEEIKSIEVNPISGSILIKHTTDIEKIAEFAQRSNIFYLIKNNKTRPTDLHSTISRAFTEMNRKVKGVTGGSFDIADAAFLSLLGLGIYQISRGNFAAPAWYTAFWYAFSIFLKSGKKETNNLT